MNEEIALLQQKISEQGYISEPELTTTLVLMQKLQRPLLLEGEAGVGKTEIARVLSRVYVTELIRLQCYEGLDANTALYEWNYSKQLLSIKLSEHSQNAGQIDIFSDEFLLQRPLLKAIQQEQPPVLLIDEVDRADDAFEAFLLELLSDFQITIPELGTVRATHKPLVILTSNNTRDLSDALRRRCLYHHLDFPDHDKECLIIHSKFPNIEKKLSNQIVSFVQILRQQDLRKRPGIAETLDWTAALLGLQVHDLFNQPELIQETRTCLVKTQEDVHFLNQDASASLLRDIA